MHEHSHFLRRDRVFFWDDGVGVPRRHYCDRNACLEHYLSMGWPNADQGARWKSRERIVEVFIDEMFLCPKCGTFCLGDLGMSDLRASGIHFEGEFIEMRNGSQMNGVTVECDREIRAFCGTLLNTKEFNFKECDNTRVCEEVRQIALSRLRRDYGAKRSKEHPWFPEPVPDIKTERKPEKLPWDEGYIYLVRCGDFHKIGLAKNTNKRLSGLKTSSPFEMKMLKAWRCKRPDLIERVMHKRFAKYRVRGEWFQLTEDVVQLLLKVEDLYKEFASDQLASLA